MPFLRNKSSKGDVTEEDEKTANFFIGENDTQVKVVGPDDQEVIIDEAIVAPDGGWGWVIVIASFLSNLVVDGTVFSFGILLNPIYEATDRKVPISTIAWVGSLATGFYFIAGPVVSAIANKFGFRVVAIGGSIIGALAVFGCYFICLSAPNMPALFVLYGVVGGIGFGLIYAPAVIAVGFYFERKRALATGIAICGSGIGTFLFPPIMNFVMEKWNWQAALIFEGIVLLSCSLFALLYRPLKPVKVRKDQAHRKSIVSSIASPEGTPLLMRIKRARDMEKWDSVNSFALSEEMIPDGNDNLDPKAKADRLYNRVRKTSITSTGGSAYNMGSKRLSVPSMLASGDQIQLATSPIPPKGKSFVGLPLKEIAEEDHCDENVKENGISHLNSEQKDNNDTNNKEEKPVLGDNDCNIGAFRNRRNSTFVTKIGSSRLTIDEMTQSRILRVSSKASLSAAKNPMYRNDIYYSGSLLRLPQYANNVNKVISSVEWTVANSTVPDGISPEEEKKSWFSFGVLKKMMDFSLLASPTFLLWAISGFFTTLGLFVPFIYLKNYANEYVGLDVSTATFVVSVIGIANTSGRIVSGWIADRPWMNALYFNNGSVTVLGLSTMVVPYLNSYSGLIGFACVFGLAMATFASLRSILLVELLGLEKLTNAFGLTLLFQGIAAMIGTPFAGFLYEQMGGYKIPFLVAGGFILFSSFLCYPLLWVKTWESKRNECESEENMTTV